MKAFRRPRIRSLVAATSVAGALVLGLAAPAYADYSSPTYSTLKACNEARPKYQSSWTKPQACRPMCNWDGTKVIGYAFLVITRA